LPIPSDAAAGEYNLAVVDGTRSETIARLQVE
jgi:hypothetical protein